MQISNRDIGGYFKGWRTFKDIDKAASEVEKEISHSPVGGNLR